MKHFPRLLVALVLAATLLANPGAATTIGCRAPPAGAGCGNPEFQSCGVNVNGINRHFCIRVLEQPAIDLPVVFNFHGGGGQATAAVPRCDKHSEQGMIIVAPSALVSASLPPSGQLACKLRWRHLGLQTPTWDDLTDADACAGQSPGLPLQGGGDNKEDLDFVAALVDQIGQSFDTQDLAQTGIKFPVRVIYGPGELI